MFQLKGIWMFNFGLPSSLVILMTKLLSQKKEISAKSFQLCNNLVFLNKYVPYCDINRGNI